MPEEQEQTQEQREQTQEQQEQAQEQEQPSTLSVTQLQQLSETVRLAVAEGVRQAIEEIQQAQETTRELVEELKEELQEVDPEEPQDQEVTILEAPPASNPRSSPGSFWTRVLWG